MTYNVFAGTLNLAQSIKSGKPGELYHSNFYDDINVVPGISISDY